MKVKEINEEIYSLSCYCRPDRDGRGECQLYPCAPGSSLPGIAAIMSSSTCFGIP